MTSKIKTVVINGAKAGYNIPELALYLCFHKDKVTHREYLQFTKWARRNEKFYYWLRTRLNAKYGQAGVAAFPGRA